MAPTAMAPPGTGVAVGEVGEGVGVRAGVGVLLGVAEAAGEGVRVALAVAEAVGSEVLVAIAGGVGVRVGEVAVAVRVGDGVRRRRRASSQSFHSARPAPASQGAAPAVLAPGRASKKAAASTESTSSATPYRLISPPLPRDTRRHRLLP
jgi:hypothetical protein